MNIGIYVYDQAEVLDFSGPFEVFTTASRVHARSRPGDRGLFEVFLVAQSAQLIRARGDFTVQPHCSFENHPAFDVLIIPGGVHSGELEKRAVIDWIARISPHTRLTASVCTGACLLAEARLLLNRPCTTHWEDVADLRARYPGLEVRENVLWVDSGKIITSAGISAGIEMALHLITRLAGKELARRTAHQMQYTWTSEAISKENE